MGSIDLAGGNVAAAAVLSAIFHEILKQAGFVRHDDLKQ
jgi:hypothetical protein